MRRSPTHGEDHPAGVQLAHPLIFPGCEAQASSLEEQDEESALVAVAVVDAFASPAIEYVRREDGGLVTARRTSGRMMRAR
jgi:hypothetical protein